MKKLISALLTLSLLVTMLCTAIPMTASAAAVEFTVSVKAVDTAYTTANGVHLYTNTTKAEKKYNSITYTLNAAKLLVFASDGRLIEAGGNLVEKKGCVQENLIVPAGGFALAFPTSNTNLMNCWNYAMNGAMLYNATLSVIRKVNGVYDAKAKTVKITYDNDTSIPKGAKRFLFIGNSCTYVNGNPLKFEALCNAAGLNVSVDYCTEGSAFLSYFCSGGKYYNELTAKLKANKYDYIVLQDASGASKETTADSVAKLMPMIKDNGATPLFYMRYPDKTAEAGFKEQLYRFYEGYSALAEKYNTKFGPSVVAYARCREKYPEIPLYADDNSHHSKEGSYLIACTWLYGFMGVDPVGNTYTADLDPDVVKKLQEIAKDAVETPLSTEGDASKVPAFVGKDGKTYKNIAEGCTYTRTGSPYSGDWQDFDGTKLLGKMTDGKVALTGDDPAIGCYKGTTTSVTVDLGKVCSVQGIFTDLWGGDWGVPSPVGAKASVAFSTDGNTFSAETQLTYAKIGESGKWVQTNFTTALSAPVSARYVRVSYTIGGSFCWTSEVAVYGSDTAPLEKIKTYVDLNTAILSGTKEAELGADLVLERDVIAPGFVLHVPASTTLTVKSGTASISLDNAGMVIVRDGATLEIEQKAQVNNDNGTIVIDKGAVFAVKAGKFINGATGNLQLAGVMECGVQNGEPLFVNGGIISGNGEIKLDSASAAVKEKLAKSLGSETVKITLNGAPSVVGDINGNGGVDAMDYMVIRSYYLKTSTKVPADYVERMDLDGKPGVSPMDIMLLRGIILGTYKPEAK